jgi:hypothetical protein
VTEFPTDFDMSMPLTQADVNRLDETLDSAFGRVIGRRRRRWGGAN